MDILRGIGVAVLAISPAFAQSASNLSAEAYNSSLKAEEAFMRYFQLANNREPTSEDKNEFFNYDIERTKQQLALNAGRKAGEELMNIMLRASSASTDELKAMVKMMDSMPGWILKAGYPSGVGGLREGLQEMVGMDLEEFINWRARWAEVVPSDPPQNKIKSTPHPVKSGDHVIGYEA